VRDQKPLFVLWSKSAVTAAGSNMADLQAKIVEEATEIISQARNWFMHSISVSNWSVCYTCRGQEDSEFWTIFVQTGWYKPSISDHDGHQNPERRSIMFPEALKEPDNETFASYGDIMKG
jgi:hypothetical protein